MGWTDQTEQQLLDIERGLADDRALRRDFARSHRIMAIRQLAGRRGQYLASGVATLIGLLTLVAGLLLGRHGATDLAALLTGAALLGAIGYALVWAVLDHRASPPTS